MRALNDTLWLILAVVLLTSVRISIPAPSVPEAEVPGLGTAQAATFFTVPPAFDPAEPDACEIPTPNGPEQGKSLESHRIPAVFESWRPVGPIRFRTLG